MVASIVGMVSNFTTESSALTTQFAQNNTKAAPAHNTNCNGESSQESCVVAKRRKCIFDVQLNLHYFSVFTSCLDV